MGSLADTVQGGNRLASLVALRDTLARAIEGCESKRDMAALSLRLTDVLAQIDELAPSSEVDVVDEIAARRNNRRAGAASGAARAQRSS